MTSTNLREPTHFPIRVRNLTAVLGPTNTGKTHLAIERMLGYESGMIGLPLRLLAREVYEKVVARAGAGAVALVTGEEKIKPENPRYWISTVEAMPQEVEVEFVAIDEIQLAGDPEGATYSPTAYSTPAAPTRRCCSAPRPCASRLPNCCQGRISSPGPGSPSSRLPVKRKSPGCRDARPW